MSIETDLEIFKNESENIKAIVRNKPASNWEYLLGYSLLESRLSNVSLKYKTLPSGVVGKKILISDEISFIDWAMSINNKRLGIVKKLGDAITKDLRESFGPPGFPGNAVLIKNAVEQIAFLCEEFISLEKEIIFIDPPPRCRKILKLMSGYTMAQYETVLEWNNRLKYVAADLEKPRPKRKYDLSLKWVPSPQDELIIQENDRITKSLKDYQKNNTSLFVSSSGKSSSKTSKKSGTRKNRNNIRQAFSLFNQVLRLFK